MDEMDGDDDATADDDDNDFSIYLNSRKSSGVMVSSI